MEIKFRGKRKDTGEWVYGYYYLECDNHYIFEDRQKESILNRNTIHGIIPETVGQYAGVTDKDDNEIYEGDIVLVDGERYTVEWAGIGNWFKDSDGDYFVFTPEIYVLKIIGTTHD